MKILHSADFHLDSPIQGRSEGQMRQLKAAQLEIPGKLAKLCKAEGCDLVLLSGDLFDGAYTRQSLDAVRTALEEMAVPVFISPGNHDFIAPESPYVTERWPENVHIFTGQSMESVELPALNCRIYGAAYHGMDCAALLENFRAEGEELYHIGVLHGDPTQSRSPYCPISTVQVAQSGLDYLALGHIHKGDSFRAGRTLCAWPGCPMGRGFDELEEKGALIVTLKDTHQARFVPLDTVRFYDYTVNAGEDPVRAVESVLPALGNEDFYRITLTGPSAGVDLAQLQNTFTRFLNLTLRDQTTPEVDLWSAIGEDTLEGVYFRMLHDAMEGQPEQVRQSLKLAASISRQILDGQEVVLP